MVVDFAGRNAAGQPVPTDDPQRLRGIGPKVDAILKSLGLMSFRQLARLEDGDIAVVGPALETLPDRIVHEDWVGRAREHDMCAYGSDPPA